MAWLAAHRGRLQQKGLRVISNYTFENLLPRSDVRIGIVVAHKIKLGLPQPILEARLKEILAARTQPLNNYDEQIRQASRDMLRNGTYRPTGRSKPASEYLLREALAGKFPRINAVVDINNYLSLKFMVPISLWDIDLAQSKHFQFRLGKAGESYIFNSANQILDLEDLICGFAVRDGQTFPMVTPVKDSLATKTIPTSENIVLALYYPAPPGSRESLQNILNETKELLQETQGNIVGDLIC